MKKIIINGIFILSGVIALSCSTLMEAQGNLRNSKGIAANSVVSAIMDSEQQEKRCVNAEYIKDTFYITVFITKIRRVKYYMAAELIHIANKIYRKMLLWEIKNLTYLILEKRPYGKSSWNFFRFLRDYKILYKNLYFRPLKGEEYRKIYTIMNRNQQSITGM